MFEGLIWSIVEYYADKYVQGFHHEAMKINLWKGSMVMDNVALNTNALRDLNLPIHVKKGTIQQLVVEIPWSRILSDPVCVKVRGLELEMIPNHQYAGQTASGDNTPVEMEGYLSLLRNKILDNLHVEIEDVKISYCDDTGHYPSILWISFHKLLVRNRKEEIYIGDDHSTSCQHCGGDSNWVSGPTAKKANLEVRKELSIQGLDIHIQDIRDDGTTQEEIKKRKENSWKGFFKEMNAIVSNVALSVSVSIIKLPSPHIHFFWIEINDPVEFHLRDTDIQAFCILVNELRALLFRERDELVSQEEPMAVESLRTEELEQERASMLSWVGSSLTYLSTGWFNTSEIDTFNEWPTEEEEEANSTPTVPPTTVSPTERENLLSEEEKEKLQDLLEQSEVLLPPATASTQHTYIHIAELSFHLIQHVACPDFLTKQFYVAPRALAKISFREIRLQQFSRAQQTKLHVTLHSFFIEDLCTVDSVFPKVLACPAPLEEEEISALHLFFSSDPLHGVQPCLKINIESIEVSCPPYLIKQIQSFFDTAIPDKTSLTRFKGKKTHPIEPISSAEENKTPLLKAEVVEIPTAGYGQARVGLNVSVEVNHISCLLATQFTSKTESDVLVLGVDQVCWHQVAQFHPQALKEVTFEITVSQASLYSCSTLHYLEGESNDLSQRFYFTNPVDFDISFRVGRLPAPTQDPPPFSSFSPLPTLSPYSRFQMIECNLSSIFVRLNSHQLSLLHIISSSLVDTHASPSCVLSNDQKDASYHTCLWKPLGGDRKKKKKNNNKKNGKLNSNSDLFTFMHTHLSCSHISISLYPNTVPVPCSIVDIVIESGMVDVVAYKKEFEEQLVRSTQFSLSSFSISDSYQTPFIYTHVHSSTPSVFASPFGSSGGAQMRDSLFSTPITPLRSSLSESRISIPIPYNEGLFMDAMEEPDISVVEGASFPAFNSAATPFPNLISYTSTTSAHDMKPSIVWSIRINQIFCVYQERIIDRLVRDFPFPSSIINPPPTLDSLDKYQLMWHILYVRMVQKLEEEFLEENRISAAACLFSSCNHSLFISVRNSNTRREQQRRSAATYLFQFPNSISVSCTALNVIIPSLSDQNSSLELDFSSPTCSGSICEEQEIPEDSFPIASPSFQFHISLPQLQAFTIQSKGEATTYSNTFFSSDSDSEEEKEDTEDGKSERKNMRSSRKGWKVPWKVQTDSDDKELISALHHLKIDIHIDKNTYEEEVKKQIVAEYEEIRMEVSGAHLTALLDILLPISHSTWFNTLQTPLEQKRLPRKEQGVLWRGIGKKSGISLLFPSHHSKHKKILSAHIHMISCSLYSKESQEIRVCMGSVRVKEKKNFLFRPSSLTSFPITLSAIYNNQKHHWHISGESNGYCGLIGKDVVENLISFSRAIHFPDFDVEELSLRTNTSYDTSFMIDVVVESLKVSVYHSEGEEEISTFLSHASLSSDSTSPTNDIIVCIKDWKFMVHENMEERRHALTLSISNFTFSLNPNPTLVASCRGIIGDISQETIEIISKIFQSKQGAGEIVATSSKLQQPPSSSLSIDITFHDAEIYFVDCNERIANISCLGIQILRRRSEKSEKSEKSDFLALLWDRTTLSCSHNLGAWETVLTSSHDGGSFQESTTLPSLSGTCFWYWHLPRLHLELQCDMIHILLKPLIITLSGIQDALFPPQPEELLTPSTLERNIQYSVSMAKVEIDYSPEHNKRIVSSILFSFDFIRVTMLCENYTQQIEASSQHIDAFYYYNPIGQHRKDSERRKTLLLELFGNSFHFLQCGHESNVKITLDCNVIRWIIPLPLLRELSHFGKDGALFFSRFTKAKKTRPGHQPIHLQLFRGCIVPIEEINKKGATISFSSTSYAGGMGGNPSPSSVNSYEPSLKGGYMWKGDSSTESKSITWNYGSVHKLRRISWINEGYAPRASVVILQYFDGACHSFVDLLCPIESNCALNRVDIGIESPVSSCVWRLLFLKPEHILQGNEENWPWISSFCIYSDPIEIKKPIKQSNDSMSLRMMVSIGKAELAVSSSLQTRNNVLFRLDSELVRSHILLAKKGKCQEPLQISGALQNEIRVFYQDFALLRMKECLRISPRFLLRCDGSGKVSLSFDHSSRPLRVQVTRPSCQLLRNVLEYLNTTLMSLSQDSMEQESSLAMFYHFRVCNRSGHPLLMRESCEDLIEDTLVIIDTTKEYQYWKWGLSHHDHSVRPLEERRVHLQMGAFALSNLDISVVGSFLLQLVHTEDESKSIRIVCNVRYPGQEEGARIPNSRTLDVEFLAPFEIISNISIPLEIRMDVERTHNLSKQGSFYCTPLSASPTLHFRAIGSHWKEVDVCVTKSTSSLVQLRSLSEKHQQFVWINIKLHKEVAQFYVKKITFSPIFTLFNGAELPLRWKIMSHRGFSLSEGFLRPDQTIPLYHTPRRRCLLYIGSGLVSADHCEWCPAYEVTRPQENKLLQLDSGVGLTEGDFMNPASVCLPIQIINTRSILSTTLIRFSAPYRVRNLTEEGLFIAHLSKDSNIHYQLYIPPKKSIPFALPGGDENSKFCVFSFLHESSLPSGTPSSLRRTATLRDVHDISGIDLSQSPSGVYPIGFTAKKKRKQGKQGQEQQHQQEESYFWSHHYLAHVIHSSVETNSICIDITTPYMITNQLRSTVIIEQVWPSSSRPLNFCDQNKPLFVLPNQTISLHHWVCTEPIRYSGIESISFFCRYEGIGWEEIECTVDDLPHHSIFHVTNRITQQHDRIQIMVEEGDIKAKHHITLSHAPVFPFSLINFTCQNLYILVGNQNEEKVVAPCTSSPISSPPQTPLSICVRLTQRHMWSDPIIINRSRNILISLFGQQGSETMKISIEYQAGSASITFRSFTSPEDPYPIVFEAENLLGYPISKSQQTEKETSANPKEEIFQNSLLWDHGSSLAILEESSTSLDCLFPSAPGFQFHCVVPEIRIIFTSEKEIDLLDCCIHGTDLTVTYYQLHSNSIRFLFLVDSLFVYNSAYPESHVPLRCGNHADGLPGLLCEAYIPYPFRKHIEKLTVQVSPLLFQLTGPFIAELLQHFPAWISALQHPTQVHKTPNTNNETKKARQTSQNSALFVNYFQISPIVLELSWLNIGSHLESSIGIPARFLSVSNLKITLRRMTHAGVPKEFASLFASFISAYKKDILMQLIPTIGSLDILGNPTHLLQSSSHFVSEYFLRLRNRHADSAGFFKNSFSLTFGILSSCIECGICLNRALRDIFSAMEIHSSLDDTYNATSFAGNVSAELNEFLSAALAEISMAVRNSVLAPFDGFYHGGAVGLTHGASIAIQGWISPLRSILDANLHLLYILRSWVLKDISLPPLTTASSLTHARALLVNNTLLTYEIESEKPLLSSGMTKSLQERGILQMNEYPEYSALITLVTSSLSLTLSLERNVVVTPLSLVLVREGQVTLHVPLLSLHSLVTRDSKRMVILYFQRVDIQLDAILTRNSSSPLYSIQFRCSTDRIFTNFIFHLLCLYKSQGGTFLQHHKENFLATLLE